MVYRVDLSEPGLFWQLRKLERNTNEKTNNHSTTVRRVDRPSGNRQSSTLRCELCSSKLDVRIQQEGVSIEEKRSTYLCSIYDGADYYGG